MGKTLRKAHYLSYLLRLWPTADGDTLIWRASLESPGSGERHGFASLSELLAYLERTTEGDAEDEKSQRFGDGDDN